MSELDYKNLVKQLRKDSFSVLNRFQSLLIDAQFVKSLDLEPIFANERCGPWHVKDFIDTCYFKSTDGHTNEWTFLMRRLNFHLLDHFKNGSLAIVDSTRKGKSMPDALLKTIPLWCAVLNCIMMSDIYDTKNAGTERAEGHSIKFILNELNELRCNSWLRVPDEVISRNEKYEMQQRVRPLADEVIRLGLIDRKFLLKKLAGKPIVPEWITPNRKWSRSLSFNTIYCVTASRVLSDPRVTVSAGPKSFSWQYVQGAGDDHELWANLEALDCNLTASQFWKLVDRFADIDTGLFPSSMDQETIISALNDLDIDAADVQISHVKNETHDTNLAWGIIKKDIDYQRVSSFHQIVIFSQHSITNIPESCKVYRYEVDSSKKGSKRLRKILPEILPNLNLNNRILVLCETGQDLSVGLILALLCIHYTTDWVPGKSYIDKDTIKRQLSQLGRIAKINPSRNTLQSVNSVIMH